MSKEPEIIGIDGTVRKAHYGAGRQPWDDIKDLNWGAQFAAGNVLKYIRRYSAKNGQDDIDKALWYWTELGKIVKSDPLARPIGAALVGALTLEELRLLKGGKDGAA